MAPVSQELESAYFRKMEKEQYRSVIRFLFLEGKSRNEIKERLDAVYGDFSPSMDQLKQFTLSGERPIGR